MQYEFGIDDFDVQVQRLIEAGSLQHTEVVGLINPGDAVDALWAMCCCPSRQAARSVVDVSELVREVSRHPYTDTCMPINRSE
jgi:hypothetical protein